MNDLTQDIDSAQVVKSQATRPSYDRILVHTFLTANYLGWAELFLESLRRHHGEQIHVRVDSRDLGNEDIALLRNVYTNIEIHNKSIDWSDLANDLGVDMVTLHKWHWQISRGLLTNENYHIKQYISVTLRYRSMAAVLRQARDGGYGYVLHSDADIYLRGTLDPFFEIVADHDVSIYLRPSQRNHAYKVLGAFMGFNLTGQVDRFIDNWMGQIDKVSPPDRWKGFGQSAIWFAINETDNLSVGDLTTLPTAPRYSKTFEDDAALWLGNSSGRASNKVISLNRSWDDHKTRLPRVPRAHITARELFRMWARRPHFGLRRRLRRLLEYLRKDATINGASEKSADCVTRSPPTRTP